MATMHAGAKPHGRAKREPTTAPAEPKTKEAAALLTQLKKDPEAVANTLLRKARAAGNLSIIDPYLKMMRDAILQIDDPKRAEKLAHAWDHLGTVINNHVWRHYARFGGAPVVQRQARTGKTALRTGTKPQGKMRREASTAATEPHGGQTATVLAQLEKDPEAVVNTLLQKARTTGNLSIIDSYLKMVRDAILRIDDPKRAEKLAHAWDHLVGVILGEVLSHYDRFFRVPAVRRRPEAEKTVLAELEKNPEAVAAMLMQIARKGSLRDIELPLMAIRAAIIQTDLETEDPAKTERLLRAWHDLGQLLVKQTYPLLDTPEGQAFLAKAGITNTKQFVDYYLRFWTLESPPS
jgi:uridine phosphorylase